MKTLKWVAIILVIMIVPLVIAIAGLHFAGQQRLNKAPEVTLATVSPATDEAGLERGQYLASISGCTSCHGEDLRGEVFIDEAPIGYVPAPNLTSGAGGIGATYTDADWESAIRHGVAADGRMMVTMPADHYAHYGDDDLAALIGYLKSVPPVDNDLGPRQIQFPGTVIFGVLAYTNWPVNVIDHASVGGNAPEAAPSAEYGAYMVSIMSCQSCHAENLAGNYGQLDTPQGPNITLGGEVADWSEEDFARTLRTGTTPDGELLKTTAEGGMPWPQYAGLSDTEVQALWAYINSLEPLPNNTP
ncbi:MAG: c-type cytochrome [Anaerolineae bacterium]|nr:c-type cytochrome [Anaerolineae bacterium]